MKTDKMYEILAGTREFELSITMGSISTKCTEITTALPRQLSCGPTT